MQSSFLIIGEICCAGSRLWLQWGLGLKNVAISIGSIILDINCPLWIERWSFCILLSSTMGNDPLGFWTCVRTSNMVWLNSHMLWEAGGWQMVDGFKRQEGIVLPFMWCFMVLYNTVVLTPGISSFWAGFKEGSRQVAACGTYIDLWTGDDLSFLAFSMLYVLSQCQWSSRLQNI